MQRNINSGLQSRRLNKYRQNTINSYCETHRNEKAYKNFKHMPDYGKGVKIETDRRSQAD